MYAKLIVVNCNDHETYMSGLKVEMNFHQILEIVKIEQASDKYVRLLKVALG